jgi:hypothetical protein
MNEQTLYDFLFSNILAQMPKDTRNMLNNTRMDDYGDYFIIKISGPKETSKGFYDYAKAVNYNKQRTAKETRNYMWVERTVKQVTNSIGGSVKYEIY